MTPLKSFDGVSRALTSLLMSAPASSSIWTMASSPRTQAYMRGVIPCGRKVQAGLIIAAPDVLFKRGKKGDDLFRGVFCNQTEQLEIVRGEEEKGPTRSRGPRGRSQTEATANESALVPDVLLIWKKKALYSAAFQRHGVTGKSCKKTVIYRESNPNTALCP